MEASLEVLMGGVDELDGSITVVDSCAVAVDVVIAEGGGLSVDDGNTGNRDDGLP